MPTALERVASLSMAMTLLFILVIAATAMNAVSDAAAEEPANADAAGILEIHRVSDDGTLGWLICRPWAVAIGYLI